MTDALGLDVVHIQQAQRRPDAACNVQVQQQEHRLTLADPKLTASQTEHDRLEAGGRASLHQAPVARQDATGDG